MLEPDDNRAVVTITMLDLYALTSEELEEIWAHLGTCVKIRCRAQQRAKEEQRNA